MKRFFRRCRLEGRSLARSTWMAPLLCLLLSGACAKIPASWRVEDLAPGTVGYAVLILLGTVSVLSCLLLLTCVVYGLRRPQGRSERICRLILAALAGVPCLTTALWTPFSVVTVTEAHAADDWRVPEGVPFEVPASFSLRGKAPEVVLDLIHAQSAPAVTEWPSTEGELPSRAEHAEELAQQHPELLRELWLRSLMLADKKLISATAIDVPNSWKDCTVLLHPEGLDAGFLLAERGNLTGWALALEEGRVTGDVPAYPVSATEQLGKGWQLSYLTKEGFTPCRHEDLEARARYRIDGILSELAADPTMATLDRLLPVRPCPGLRLREEGIGYGLTLCLPKELRTDGHYAIRAFEYESGTPLKLDRRARSVRPADLTALAEHRLLVFEHFEVLTGRGGQYYGSRWQIVFIPDQGPEEILSEQLFLMTGRWL